MFYIEKYILTFFIVICNFDTDLKFINILLDFLRKMRKSYKHYKRKNFEVKVQFCNLFISTLEEFFFGKYLIRNNFLFSVY